MVHPLNNTVRADLTEDTHSCQTLDLLTRLYPTGYNQTSQNKVWVEQPLTKDTPSDQI